MGKVTFKDYDRSDPFYKEGPLSYSPHWARTLLRPAKPSLPDVAGKKTQQPASGKPDNEASQRLDGGQEWASLYTKDYQNPPTRSRNRSP